jgi:hypothetical protein
MLLKDNEKPPGHVGNNLLILLKKSLNFVDHTNAEIPLRS